MDWNNINRDRDTSGLGPIEYDQSKVPALIRKHADYVRTKTYGQEVREAQARNAELAGLIASEAKDISVNSDRLANDISSRFNDQISGSTSISEVIDARKPVGKPTHSTLNDRLESDKKFRDQIYLNILDTVDDPKTITDWIPVINAAILKVRDIGGGSVYFPSYTYIVKPTLDSFIKIASGVNLIGAYKAVIKVSDNNPDFFNMIHTYDGGIYGCKIEGLTFDTNGENQTSQVTIDRDKCRMLMRLEVISDFTVTNCKFYYSGINAIIATGTMYDHRNTVIQGNYFEFKNQGLLPYDNTALYIGTMGHIITNNVFESETESDGLTARTAIETHSSYGIINDNIINNFMAGVLVLGVDYRDYDYAKTITPKNISNNIIMNCLGGVLFWSSVNDVKHAVISGNTIFINHVKRNRFAEGYYGIALDHNAGGLDGANTVGDVLITGNSIKFEVSETWLTSAEMPEISNYNFEGAFAIGSYTGLGRFTNVKNVTITGNQVINSPRMPFSLSNFGGGTYEDIIIENNTAINSITQRMVPIRHKTGLLISGQANGVVYQKNTFVDSREKIYITTEFCTPPDTSKIKRIKIKDNSFQLNQGHVGTASRLPFIVKGEGWDIYVDKLRTYPNRDAMAGSTLFYNDIITLGLPVDTRNTFLVTGSGTLGTTSLAGTWYIDGSVLKVPDSIDIRTIYPIQQIKINKADGSDLFTATQILGVDYINNEILISHFNTIYKGACTVSFVKPSTNSSALNATF